MDKDKFRAAMRQVAGAVTVPSSGSALTNGVAARVAAMYATPSTTNSAATAHIPYLVNLSRRAMPCHTSCGYI